MHIEKAGIKNFKGIKNTEITFHPGFNLIKGENGKGKTSILEALAIGLSGYITGVRDIEGRNFTNDEVHRDYTRKGDGSLSEDISLPVEVSIDSVIDGYGQVSWTRLQGSVSQENAIVTSPDDITRIAEEMSNTSDVELPLVNYQSVGRVWNLKHNLDNIFREKYLRTVGYVDTFTDSSNRDLFLNWCVKMEQIAWQKKQDIREYEAVKKAAADFMKYMDGSDLDYTVTYDRQFECIVFDDGRNITPINELSAGYQSLIWMVLDIAYRMAVLNPFRLDDIAKTSGVVLIDELDMHLHPRWQWRIIDSLRKVFPNIQFIAATHSPILFSSAKDVWIIDVDGDEIEYSESHYGLDVNSSVERYQGEFVLPDEISKLYRRFCDAMDKEDYKSAKTVLDSIEEKTAPEAEMVTEMKTRYDLETSLLEV